MDLSSLSHEEWKKLKSQNWTIVLAEKRNFGGIFVFLFVFLSWFCKTKAKISDFYSARKNNSAYFRDFEFHFIFRNSSRGKPVRLPCAVFANKIDDIF